MNIRLINADNQSAAFEKIIDIARKEARGNLDPIYIIVPDRATVQAEKMLLSGGGCFLNTEIITFSKLFYLLYDELGAAIEQKVLDKTSAVLFMWRAVQDVKDKLVWFTRSVGHYAFAEKMFNTINQLTSSLADFEKLESNARQGSVTQKKMHDIAIIWRAYKKLIKEYTDSSGQLGFLIDNIKKSRTLAQIKIFIAGFEHLSIQRGAVVTELAKKACMFIAGVRKGSEFEQFIKTACFDLGISPETEKVTFDTPLNAVQVKEFDTVQAEVEWTANQISLLVKRQNVRFRDITVCLCDFENDVKIYSQVFGECGIAINTDVGESLLSNALTQYLKEYLALSSSGRSEHFINIIKSVYTGLAEDDEFKLENLALKTNMRTNELTLPHIKKLQKCRTASDYCKVLIGLVPDENTGKAETTVIDQTVRQKIIEMLETVANISGEMEMNIGQFSNLFCTLAAATKVSGIPVFADAVTLVGTAEHQPCFTQYLFVTGAVETMFPIRQDDTDIITGQDISNLAVRIEPSCELQNTRNRIHAMNVLKSFTKQCFITFSGQEPTRIIEDFKIPFSNKTQDNDAELDLIANKSYATGIVLRAISDGTAFENPIYYNSVLRALDIGDLSLHDLFGAKANINNGKDLFFRGGSGRVTQIENFYKCPYYHFLTSGLALRMREKYQMASNVMGTLIHKIAEEFTDRIIRHKDLATFNGQQEIQAVVKGVLGRAEFCYLCTDPTYKPIVANLKREANKIANTIINGIKESDYFPCFTELPVEKYFGEIKLKGKIDRIDTAEIDGQKHAIIIDYKTGADSGFSHKKLEKGVKLQLPLYMSFLQGKYAVDGAYYLSLSGGYSAKENESAMRGIKKNVAEAIIKSEELAFEAIQKISGGYIQPCPAEKKVCEYCIARSMCGETQNKANGNPDQTKWGDK